MLVTALSSVLLLPGWATTGDSLAPAGPELTAGSPEPTLPAEPVPAPAQKPTLFGALFGNDGSSSPPPAQEPGFFDQLFGGSQSDRDQPSGRTLVASVGDGGAESLVQASTPPPAPARAEPKSLLGALFGSLTDPAPARPVEPKPTASRPSFFDFLSGAFSPDSHGGGADVHVVRTTAYTHTEIDHLKYGRKTAAGTRLQASQRYNSAAADWSRYPLGTKFKIKGDPTIYVVDDYGRALVGTGTIDIYKPSRASMNDWGVRNVEIEVLEDGDSRLARAILEKRLHYEHCRTMYRALQLNPFS